MVGNFGTCLVFLGWYRRGTMKIVRYKAKLANYSGRQSFDQKQVEQLIAGYTTRYTNMLAYT